jgi:hypothetical protein
MKFGSGLTIGVALLVLGVAGSARAQQNPFVGTWSTSLRLSNGSGFAAYLDFYPNGALHLSGVVTGVGQPSHLCGSYQFNQTTLQTVYTAYTPRLCAGPVCDPPAIPLDQPFVEQYQFPNPNELLTSGGSRYVRAPGNPFPLPPTGCN